jgi:xanthine dehydrogenase accessory factor
MPAPAALSAFLTRNPAVIVAELTSVRGSSPREAGAYMLIAAGEALGTIGGGALEYLVIDRARQVLRDGLAGDSLDIPLGPEIGQCCGGRVEISMRIVDEATAARLAKRAAAEEEARPDVFVFGAGHVGKALARALVLLPVKVHVLDTRPAELAGVPEGGEARAVALPEAVVRGAPTGSAFVIVTHDHALDFLIAREALEREDAAYIGMVGSASKRARFVSWYVSEGGDRTRPGRLVLPIGRSELRDKRPEVIACLAAAEIMVHIGLGRAGAEAAAPVRGATGTIHGR